MGISYFDGQNSVLISELKNSVGQLVSPNKVVYSDAFTDFKADLVCTYRKGGFECDLILREQPPAPEKFGLSSENIRLELLTEFFDSPEPDQTQSIVSMADRLTDTTLKFGRTTFAHGKAFVESDSALEPNKLPELRVYKSWLHLDGRTFLVEEVPYRKIVPDLQSLPMSANATLSASAALRKVSPKRLLVPSHLAQNSTNTIQFAKA